MNVRQNGQMSDGKRHFKTSVRRQMLIRPNKGRKKIWLFLMYVWILVIKWRYTIKSVSQDHMPMQSCFCFGMNLPSPEGYHFVNPLLFFCFWTCISKGSFFKKGMNQSANILRMKCTVSEPIDNCYKVHISYFGMAQVSSSELQKKSAARGARLC